MRLVAHVAKKYQNTDYDMEDLLSVGTIGLIKAVSTFHPDRGSRLATYAAKCLSLIHIYFRQVIDVDLNAPFIVSKAVIPSMIKKGHGKIINICSMMSEFGRETVSAYAAAKGGLKMLTRNICSEYGEHNIQCNGIGPG